MKGDQIKAVLAAAADLPPEQARRVVNALSAKPSMESVLADARENFMGAMSYVLLQRLMEEEGIPNSEI